MHEFVSFNHQISHPQQINLPALSSAALYGKGVFTTIAIYQGQPFLWKKHWIRLTENAKRLSIDLSGFPENVVKETFHGLIKKNKVFNARSRLTFFDQSSSEIWKVETAAKSGLLITTADFRDVSGKISLTVSSYPINSRSPLVNIKSCNYLENIYALREVQRKGFDEAIRLNEKGEIASACLANIFWVKDRQVFTPALQTGVLRGTTREFITESFDVFEVNTTLTEIEKAETVFITSAGIGVVEVSNFGKVEYKSTEIFSRIKDRLDQFKEISQDSNGHLDL